MRKTLTTILSLAATLSMTAASVMDQGTTLPGYGAPLEDSYVSTAYQLIMTWDEQMVHFVDGATKSFIVTDPKGIQNEYGTIYLESQYAGVTEATTVVFSFDYAYNTGEYEVTIPSGIIANAQGDINPAQTVYFNYGWQMGMQNVTPEQSNYYYNGWTGETTLPPYYTSEQVANVTAGFLDGITIQLTHWGEITATKEGTTINITNLVSLVDNKLKLDLSNLEDGTWTINVPEGFLKGYNENNVMYVNNAFTLKYMIINNYSPITEYTILSPSTDAYYLNSLGSMQVFFGGEPFSIVEGKAAIITYNGEEREGALSLGYNESKGFVLDVQVGGYEPGLYQIKVPSGSIEAGEYTNPEITAEYYVVQQIYGGYEVSPENNAMVSTEDMKKIIITYPEYQTIVPFSDETNVEIVVGDYEEFYNLTMGNGIEISGNQIILSPKTPIQQAHYIISIYGNNFILDNNYTNEYIMLNYNVWDGMQEALVIERPGIMSTYNASIKLTWDYQPITPTENFGVNVTYGWFGDSLDVPSSALTIESGNIVSINLSEYLKAYLDEDDWNSDTEINVTFPAGIVKNAAGLMNPSQTISFTLYQIWNGEMQASVYPAAENTIQIYWDGDLNFINTRYDAPAILYINNGSADMEIEDCGWGEPDFGYYSTTGYIDDNWDNGPCVLVNVGDTPGYYTLIIPEASFTLRNSYYIDFTNVYGTIVYQIDANGDITIGDMSSKINNIESDGIYHVFNLQGINILNTKDLNEVLNLNKGVYIVNGKKVIL